ncbi:MAG: hypothetical protein H5T96_03155 [Tissierellales bacterium]|nr:hypothetical protein [Tissierellales bacterium]
MKELNYDFLMQINSDIYYDLDKYIDKKNIRKVLFNKVSIEYPVITLDKENTIFNLWLICDYKNEKGETLIDEYLNERRIINNLEREILIQKKKSYPSLYEILNIVNDKIVAKNLFTTETIEILEPSAKRILKQGDCFIARIENILGHNIFSGQLIYTPKSVIPYFIKEVFYDYNYELSKDFSLSFQDYVKDNCFKFYDLFYINVYEHFDPSEEDISSIYDDIEEFQNYLYYKKDPLLTDKYINKLLELYDYYLSPEDLSLRDLNRIDLNELFLNTIYDGFISSSETFSLYLDVLTEYILFKENQTNDFHDSLEQIKQIRENRFDFIREINKGESHFYKDKYLVSKLNEFDLTFNDDFIKDFDVFLIYLISNNLSLTDKKQKIKKSDKMILIENLFKTYEFNDLYSSADIIDIFKALGLSLNIIEINDNKLIPSNIVEDYLILSNEEKMQVLLSEIFKIDFISSILNIDIKNAEKSKELLLKLMAKLMRNPMPLKLIIDEIAVLKKELSTLIYILYTIGLVDLKNNNLTLTRLGKICFPFINQWSRRKMDNILIFTLKN